MATGKQKEFRSIITTMSNITATADLVFNKTIALLTC